MGAVNTVGDVFKRHKHNFDQIFPPDKTCILHNDVQALMMFLWAFFVNSRELFEYIDKDLVTGINLSTSTGDEDFVIKKVNSDECITFIRHSVSHGNFVFHRHKEGSSISGVTLFNVHKKKFEITHLDLQSLRNLISELKINNEIEYKSYSELYSKLNCKTNEKLFNFIKKIDIDMGYQDFFN